MTDDSLKKTAIPEKAAQLRGQHHAFRYERYSVTPISEGLRLDYRFTIEPNLEFSPHIEIPLRDPLQADRLCNDLTVRRLAFLTGMVEILSYWKLCCSPRIEIAAGYLSEAEIRFWDALIRKGLGEFFYTNHITPNIDLSIVSFGKPEDHRTEAHPKNPQGPDSYLVLVGGGKDSIVSLELLRELPHTAGATVTPFALNPIPASLEGIHSANYPDYLLAKRTIDPKLRDLNSNGYLNGHTPFSALIAFIATLTAYTNGQRFVLASNEASANEGNIDFDGFKINHQYSKSLEFESAFRTYISQLHIPVEYVSLLRPLNEIQICALFSTMSRQHPIFRSCNREQTLAARSRHAATHPNTASIHRQGWCADCPKCVFTFLCLRCFLAEQELQEIFGVSVDTQPHFISLASSLAGFSDHKPFECVGTYEEVQSSLVHLISNQKLKLPGTEATEQLQRHLSKTAPVHLAALLNRWNDHHFLTSPLESLLRSALQQFNQAHTL
jgi:hypothetical protein